MSFPDPKSHHLEITRTARYFTVGSADEPVTDLWIALHGYGQLAGDFAMHFKPHQRPGRLIVVPEGLSRFYRNNRERLIGASWMTAEDRKMEIRDYVAYLNELYLQISNIAGGDDTSLTVLGFSQGTATATRWLADQSVVAQRLILWGGIPAFELCSEEFQSRVRVPRIQFVAGTDDAYLSPARHAELQPTLSKNGNDIECLVFTGSHAIDEAMLARLFEDETGPKTPMSPVL